MFRAAHRASLANVVPGIKPPDCQRAPAARTAHRLIYASCPSKCTPPKRFSPARNPCDRDPRQAPHDRWITLGFRARRDWPGRSGRRGSSPQPRGGGTGGATKPPSRTAGDQAVADPASAGRSVELGLAGSPNSALDVTRDPGSGAGMIEVEARLRGTGRCFAHSPFSDSEAIPAVMSENGETRPGEARIVPS